MDDRRKISTSVIIARIGIFAVIVGCVSVSFGRFISQLMQAYFGNIKLDLCKLTFAVTTIATFGTITTSAIIALMIIIAKKIRVYIRENPFYH